MHFLLHTPILVVSSSALLIGLSLSAYQGAVRYTEFVDELQLRGVAVPTGIGISVTQVESLEPSGGYMPNTSDNEFSGKTITARSAMSLVNSGHATTVGRNLYGNSISMAPSVATIDVYEAGDWLNDWADEVLPINQIPPIELNLLQNHSWVSFSDTGVAPERMDYAVERDGFLPIVGLYNSDFGNQDTPTDIPETYGSIYNGISVGVSDGSHRFGLTETIYGAGRTKPEIVAPSGFTSFATPYVTAAAAMLIETAGSDTEAKRQQVVKATLLAGANKDVFVDWDQTTQRPLDEIYGAGQLDVYEAYFIQAGGKQSEGNSIDHHGWNFTNLSFNGSHNYTLSVPVGFELRNISILLTWNRTVTRIGNSLDADPLPNLLLLLEDISDDSIVQQSDSFVDNIEHIWRDSSMALLAGDYRLTVSTDLSADYAIAWRSELYQDYTLWSAVAFSSATPIEEQDFDDDPDRDGITNRLEQAFGGDPEVDDIEILPTSELVFESENNYFEISFRKPSFENGFTYTVETVAELDGIWSSAAADVELVSINEESSEFDRYTYRLVDPISDADKAFVRVSVTE